jgi:hypothetical protein
MTKQHKLFAILGVYLLWTGLSVEKVDAVKGLDCAGMYKRCMIGNGDGYNPNCQAYGAAGAGPVKACDGANTYDVTWSVPCGAGCLAVSGCETPCPQPTKKRVK